LLRVLRDEALIEEARRVANELVSSDPKLAKHPALAAQVSLLKEEERSAFLDKG
jgi:ATP-dependent DNA helicase RecG